jgi:hypothetical protein
MRKQRHDRRWPVKYQGETLSLQDWAARLGCSYQALAYRVKAGWPLEEAFTRPFLQGNRWRRGR